MLKELQAAGHADDTLVIYTSDNGIPFPSGRTNLYEAGMREPLVVASPAEGARRGQASGALVSLLDVAPTVLDWLAVPAPEASLSNDVWHDDRPRSLLPILVKGTPSESEPRFEPLAADLCRRRYPLVFQSRRRRRTMRCSRRRRTTRSPCTTPCAPCARATTSSSTTSTSACRFRSTRTSTCRPPSRSPRIGSSLGGRDASPEPIA